MAVRTLRARVTLGVTKNCWAPLRGVYVFGSDHVTVLIQDVRRIFVHTAIFV